MKHHRFTEIEQFRHAVKLISDRNAYIGQDEDGNAMFDRLKPKPILTATGTVKLHGTNASYCYNASETWCQSRENIIEVGKDNAGFAAFVHLNKEVFAELAESVATKNKIDVQKNTILIYGEWCGQGIQKGVAISELPKMFVIFGVKVTPFAMDEETESAATYWVDHSYLKAPDCKIFNISDFKTYSLEIDFNNPEIAQNKMIEITDAVDKCCPVGEAFGVHGHGEGVVWVINFKNDRIVWKVKGESHSKSSKVKTLKPVDLEKLSVIDKCVEEITHEWRFAQGLTVVFGVDFEQKLDRAKLGEYLKFIAQDTLKEEYDIIEKYGFEAKDVMSKVSQKAKEYFFEVEKNSIGA